MISRRRKKYCCE